MMMPIEALMMEQTAMLEEFREFGRKLIHERWARIGQAFGKK